MRAIPLVTAQPLRGTARVPEHLDQLLRFVCGHSQTHWKLVLASHLGAKSIQSRISSVTEAQRYLVICPCIPHCGL